MRVAAVVLMFASRHLILRVLCVGDRSSLATPTLFPGLVAHWFTSHCFGGQIYDRPATTVLARMVGAENSGTTNTGAGSKGGPHSYASPVTIERPSSLTYLQRWYTRTIWRPWAEERLYRQQQRGCVESFTTAGPAFTFSALFSWLIGVSMVNNTSNSATTPTSASRHASPPHWREQPLEWASCMISSGYNYFSALYATYALSWHFVLPLMSMVFGVCWYLHRFGVYLPFVNYAVHFVEMLWSDGYTDGKKVEWSVLMTETRRSGSRRETDSLSLSSMFESNDGAENSVVVSYDDSLLSLFLFLIVTTQFLSLDFARIIFPWPDLVAGSSVQNDVRLESQHNDNGAPSLMMWGRHNFRMASMSSQPGSNKRGHTWGRGKDNLGGSNNSQHTSFGASFASLHPAEIPWMERVKPISSACNRVRLHFWVMIVRIVEAIILFVWVPREYAYSEMIAESIKSGGSVNRKHFSSGIASPFRHDDHDDFYIDPNMGVFRRFLWSIGRFTERDYASFLWITLSAAIIAATLLSAHALVMNRTYLSILAHIAGDWEQVPADEAEALATSSTPPRPWDPRQKYAKAGEVVTFRVLSWRSHTDVAFRSTVPHPIGRPLEMPFFFSWLRAEVGPLSTSKCLDTLVSLHCFVLLTLGIIGAVLTLLFGMPISSHVLLLLAHGVALSAVLHLSDRCGSSNGRDVLFKVNEEIHASVKGK